MRALTPRQFAVCVATDLNTSDLFLTRSETNDQARYGLIWHHVDPKDPDVVYVIVTERGRLAARVHRAFTGVPA